MILEKFFIYHLYVLSLGFLMFVICMDGCVAVCTFLCAYLYVYVLLYHISFLGVIYFVIVQSTWILRVIFCTGFRIVIGFLTFPFNISIKVQYSPRYHNFRGGILKIYGVIMYHCIYVCKSHEYYMNVVDYLLILGICGLFCIEDFLLHRC